MRHLLDRLIAAIEYRLWVEPDEFAMIIGWRVDHSRPFKRTYRDRCFEGTPVDHKGLTPR